MLKRHPKLRLLNFLERMGSTVGSHSFYVLDRHNPMYLFQWFFVALLGSLKFQINDIYMTLCLQYIH